MKFSKLSQLFLVSTLGLLVATLLTACQIVTIDYVFIASSAGSGTSSNGQIDIFAADSESGALRAAHSPISTGGINPVALAVTANYQNLYVANQGDNTVVHMAIANDGTLTAKDTLTLGSQGTTPVALAVNTAGTLLFVVSANQPSTSATPNSGALAVFSLGTDGAIGTAASNGGLSYWPLNLYGPYASYSGDAMAPTGVTVLPNGAAVYVTAYDQAAYNPGGSITSSANPGWVFGFTVGSGGALTPAPSPYQAGVKPTAIADDPTNRFVYVTDFASNELIGYTVQSGSLLNFMLNGPFKTGNEPESIVVDPRGKYIYVANQLDSSVSAYVIDLSTGTPSAAVNVTGSPINSTDTEPVSILVDPALGRFVYTANFLGNSVSGFRLNPDTGALTATQSTPYPSSAQPRALASIPHGNHSIQSTTP
jgi:YVTN family beta-propeller protein